MKKKTTTTTTTTVKLSGMNIVIENTRKEYQFNLVLILKFKGF